MAYVKLGKTTLFSNKDANDQNKQPHFKGNIEIEHDIPAGASIGLAGWLNEKNGQKSLFFALSCKDEELEKVIKVDSFDELKKVMEDNAK
tara:strand:- start:3347 stop:3616 length:270 start_codon:yes stop_codon:yes gene_type:complete